ncbi:MAG: hypothetical protein AB1529_03020 [Candidatus Micrarchaeota archaeon]
MTTSISEPPVVNIWHLAPVLVILAAMCLSSALDDRAAHPETGVLAALASGHIEFSDADNKKKDGPFSFLLALISKMHFIVGLGMFLFVALMVVEDSLTARALLLLPVVLLFMASKVLFAIDQANSVDDMMRRYRDRYSGLHK